MGGAVIGQSDTHDFVDKTHQSSMDAILRVHHSFYINSDHTPVLVTLERSVPAFNKCLVPNLSLPSDEVTSQKFAQLPLSFCPNLSKGCG